MECSCSINSYGGCDYDEISCYRMIEYKASKNHVCGECGTEIKKGAKYKYESMRFDGEFHRYKTCNDCISIRDNLFHSWLYENIIDDLKEEVRNCNGDIPEKCISKLTPRAREMVCGMIEDVWADMDDEQ